MTRPGTQGRCHDVSCVMPGTRCALVVAVLRWSHGVRVMDKAQITAGPESDTISCQFIKHAKMFKLRYVQRLTSVRNGLLTRLNVVMYRVAVVTRDMPVLLSHPGVTNGIWSERRMDTVYYIFLIKEDWRSTLLICLYSTHCTRFVCSLPCFILHRFVTVRRRYVPYFSDRVIYNPHSALAAGHNSFGAQSVPFLEHIWDYMVAAHQI